jgi:hypothetical protein
MNKRSIKAPAPETIEEIVAAYDRAARDAAWQWRQTDFNHTKETIALLEEMLGELYDELHRPSLRKKIGLGTSDVDIEQWANLWGIYLGETLRTQFGGEWIMGHEEAPNLLGVEFTDGTTIFPTARVFRRLEQGAEQSVMDYYAMVVEEVGSM